MGHSIYYTRLTGINRFTHRSSKQGDRIWEHVSDDLGIKADSLFMITSTHP